MPLFAHTACSFEKVVDRMPKSFHIVFHSRSMHSFGSSTGLQVAHNKQTILSNHSHIHNTNLLQVALYRTTTDTAVPWDIFDEPLHSLNHVHETYIYPRPHDWSNQIRDQRKTHVLQALKSSKTSSAISLTLFLSTFPSNSTSHNPCTLAYWAEPQNSLDVPFHM